MGLICKHLLKKNKILKARIQELEQELEEFKNECDDHKGVLLDTVDSYFKERKLYNDFRKYINAPKVVHLGSHSNKLLKTWRDLKL